MASPEAATEPELCLSVWIAGRIADDYRLRTDLPAAGGTVALPQAVDAPREAGRDLNRDWLRPSRSQLWSRSRLRCARRRAFRR